MLQLKAKRVSISQISKILVSYNVSASITNENITLDGDITDKLIEKLCECIECIGVQNFISKIPENIQENSEFDEAIFENIDIDDDIDIDDNSDSQIQERTKLQAETIPEYKLRFPYVKRGGVFLCDFGKRIGHEISFMRPVIVIQTNNINGRTVLVIPCTTKDAGFKSSLKFEFSSETMASWNCNWLFGKTNFLCISQITTVDKTRLRKYLGKMNSKFMEDIQEKLDYILSLKDKNQVVEKVVTEYVEKIVEVPVSVPVQSQKVIQNVTKVKKDVNPIQLELLTYVDINSLFAITQSSDTFEIKTKKILELFGFDFNKNGVEFLLEVIISEPKKSDYNLESLTKSVAQKLEMDSEEISRLVIARVKEMFHFKKAPTMDFIRLVRSFVIK